MRPKNSRMSTGRALQLLEYLIYWWECFWAHHIKEKIQTKTTVSLLCLWILAFTLKIAAENVVPSITTSPWQPQLCGVGAELGLSRSQPTQLELFGTSRLGTLCPSHSKTRGSRPSLSAILSLMFSVHCVSVSLISTNCHRQQRAQEDGHGKSIFHSGCIWKRKFYCNSRCSVIIN